jgi:hypothetical protein
MLSAANLRVRFSYSFREGQLCEKIHTRLHQASKGCTLTRSVVLKTSNRPTDNMKLHSSDLFYLIVAEYPCVTRE